MKTFSRREKVSPKKMASDIWGVFVQIMQYHFAKAREFDREAFYKEHGWDYDKKRFTEESSHLFAFLIFNEVSNFFPEKRREILSELSKIMTEHDMGFLLDGLEEYSAAWNGALAREEEIDDGAQLNNPLFQISKLASIRCFGEEDGLDPPKIIMFGVRINPFVQMLNDNLERYEVV